MPILSQPAADARASFAKAFGCESRGVAWAPGRVNLIGEHTDYNDGFVLPIALERGVAAAFAPRADGVLRAHAAAFSETRETAIDRLAPKSERQWLAYVAGTIWALVRAGVHVGGLDIAIAGDLPIGAGLSSSAAIEMAVARAACAASPAGDTAWDPRAMAKLGQRAENEYVGVSCGIMDQFASAASVDGHALLVDCRSLDTRAVAIPSAGTIVVMDTGVRRALAASEYNERRAACERAVDAVRSLAPDVRALRDVDRDLLERARDRMDADAYRRARHVVAEIRRPLEMAAALDASDLARAGRLMDDSHSSLRDFFDVSSTELDAMVNAARRHGACFGARLTGAGFGGCAVALVAADGVEEFRKEVEAGYAMFTGRQARTFSSRPARGAHLI